MIGYKSFNISFNLDLNNFDNFDKYCYIWYTELLTPTCTSNYIDIIILIWERMITIIVLDI